jgi:hypothetical protein
MKLQFFFLLLVTSICFSAKAQTKSAFKAGEELKFRVQYGWFKTSEATLSVKNETLDGVPVHRISGMGKTTGMMDIFFKVRDNFESFVSKQNGLPLKFIRNTSEGGHKKDRVVTFNHISDSATVQNYKRNTVSSHPIEEQTQDLLSALYALRNSVDINDLEIGQEFYLNLFFDEENFVFKAKYMGEEVLDTDFGKVKTLKFRPYVQAERVFKEEESVTIWVSKDNNKIPLKIEAELAVGSLTANLEEFRGLAHPFSSIVFD